MKVIAVVQEKGGVGKSTTCYALASIKAMEGYNVLMIDLDKQASLTKLCGINREEGDKLDKTIYELLKEPSLLKKPSKDNHIPIRDILESIQYVDCFEEKRKGKTQDKLFFIPANFKVQTADRMLTEQPRGGQRVLKNLLAALDSDENDVIKFDYVFIDCAPAVNTLMVNSLMAADYAILPTLAQDLSVERLDLVAELVEEIVSEGENPDLKYGVLVTMYKGIRTTEKEILKNLEGRYDVIGIVKDAADVNKAVDKGISITVDKPYHPVSLVYGDVAKKL